MERTVLACMIVVLHAVSASERVLASNLNTYDPQPGSRFPIYLTGYMQSSQLTMSLSSGTKHYVVVSIALEKNLRRDVQHALLIQVRARTESKSLEFGWADVVRYEDEVRLVANGKVHAVWRLQSAAVQPSSLRASPAIEIRYLRPRVPYTHDELLQGLAQVSR